MTIFCKYNIKHFSITALTAMFKPYIKFLLKPDRRITYEGRRQINDLHFFSETVSKIITTLNIPWVHSLKS